MRVDDRGVVVLCASCGQKNRLAYERLRQTSRCGHCHHELTPPASPIEVDTVADFDRLVTAASVPVVVDFWAPWCGPCRMVAPQLEQVARKLAGRILVVKVNTDALPELGERFNVRSIPMMAVFAGGREAGRMVGARPAADIEAFIEQHTAAKTQA